MANNLSIKTSTVWDQEFSKRVDLDSTKLFGIDPLALMESAGSKVAEYIKDNFKDHEVVCFIGGGNNGGDGVVAARLLKNFGFPVRIFSAFQPGESKLSESLQKQITNTRLSISHYKNLDRKSLSTNAVIIDALLGLGLKGEVSKSEYTDAINLINSLKKDAQAKVVAVDLPSGLCADDLSPRVHHVNADVTITFGGLKPAHILANNKYSCGQVLAFDIGFSKSCIDDLSKSIGVKLESLSSKPLLDPFDDLEAGAHKFDRGHILVIGGSRGKIGAPLLAGFGALRMGAGWVSLALSEDYTSSTHEFTYEDFYKNGQFIAKDFKGFVIERKVKAVVIGPGMIEDNVLNSELLEFLKEQRIMTVIDAGATSKFLSKITSPLDADLFLVTPHPGEWNKMGLSALNSCNDFSNITELCRKKGITLVYKSATPIVFHPSHAPLCLSSGSNIMAKAGMGDVLSGMSAATGALCKDARYAFVFSYTQSAKLSKMLATHIGRDHSVLPSDVASSFSNL